MSKRLKEQMGCIKVERRNLREQTYSLFYVLFKSFQYVLHVYKCVVKDRANNGEVFYQGPGGCFNDFCFYPDPAAYDSI